jgi:hypothetical protein
MPWNASIVDSQILAVHAALLPSGSQGEVVLFGGDEHWSDQQESAGGDKFKKTRIYDVGSHSIAGAIPPSPDTDVFCCHHAFTADGRLLIGGGTSKWPGAGGAHNAHFPGHRRCWLYNARARTWIEAAAYNREPGQTEEVSGGRWYPGMATLANGDVVSLFGHPMEHDGRHRNVRPERYSHAANTWLLLPNDMADPDSFPSGVTRPLYFPRAFQLPDGSLFIATPMPVDFAEGVGDFTYYSTRFDPNLGEYSGATINGPAFGGYLDWSRTALLLPLLPAEDYRPRVLFAGDTTAVKIDLDPGIAAPAWQNTAPRDASIAARTRTYSYCVMLPTGQVCVVGGVDPVEPEVGVQKVEIYDPGINWATGQYGNPDAWSVKEAGQFIRNYHCTALLLPNGKVWVAGSDHDGMPGDPDIVGVKKIELYEPDYIGVANRIQIQLAPIILSYGEAFDVTIDQPAANVQRVALIRNGTATHSTNNDQRYIGLSIASTSLHVLTLAAPPNGNVAPPGYYMLWVIDNAGNPCQLAKFIRLAHLGCEVVTDLSTYSQEQVQSLGGGGTATFDNALYVNFEGFIDNELGGPPSFALTWDDDGTAISTGDLTLVSNGRWREIDPPPPDIPQRITFPFRVKFLNMNVFGTFPDTRKVRVTFTLGVHSCSQTIDLTKSPNPYMLDIDPEAQYPFWLSTDVRVFRALQSQQLFGNLTQGSGANAPYTFIKQVLDKFITAPNDNSHPFLSISQDESDSGIEWATSIAGLPIYNYAVAKVRYRAVSTVATNVKVFFRTFNVAVTGLDYHANNYPNTGPGPDTVPLIGAPGGEISSIPYFLSPRVETVQGASGATSMSSQPLDTTYEVRSITPTAGAEVTMYFGCWLDTNQTKKRFPLIPGNSTGPWPAGDCVSLQELIRGHQCLVAEVYFEPDPTDNGETPGSSDNLAQRNLAILDVDNPGTAASHTVLHTFEVKPSSFKLPGKTRLAAFFAADSFASQRTRPDELLIRWHNLPRDSEVELYFSDIDTADILLYGGFRSSPPAFEVVNKNTIRFKVADDTWLPIPGGRALNIPALLGVKLPDNIVYGQEFRISVHQVDGRTRSIIGAFEIKIPVIKAELMLDGEVRRLSVLKHIATTIPPGNRWYPIFKQYLYGLSAKVDAIGGDSKTVLGNPDGSGNLYVPVPPPANPCYQGWAVSLLVALLLLAAGMVSSVTWLVVLAVIGVISLAVLIGYWARLCHCHVWCSVLDYVVLGTAVATLGLLTLALTGGGGAFIIPMLVIAAVLTALLIVLSFVLGCRGACCEGPCGHCGEPKWQPILNWIRPSRDIQTRR